MNIIDISIPETPFLLGSYKKCEKEKNNLITGIDIGTSTVRIVVAQIAKVAEEQQLNIIGVIEVPSQGVSKGSIVSIEDAVSSLSNALENTERMIGLPVANAWIGISGTHITSQESNGVIAISRTSG